MSYFELFFTLCEMPSKKYLLDLLQEEATYMFTSQYFVYILPNWHKILIQVPPIPFGSRSTSNRAVNPTTNPIDDPRKVTVRTVLRRPPIRIQQVPKTPKTPKGPPKTTTTRSETPWTPINSTVTTHQRRTRVKIKDSLLARVQGTLVQLEIEFWVE